MVCGLLPANSCEELMYPAYYYYLASVGRPDSVGIRSNRYSGSESSEQKSKYDLLETKSPPSGDLGGRYLFSDTEFFNQLAITCKVMFLKIVKQTLTFTNQLHQAAVS